MTESTFQPQAGARPEEAPPPRVVHNAQKHSVHNVVLETLKCLVQRRREAKHKHVGLQSHPAELESCSSPTFRWGEGQLTCVFLYSISCERPKTAASDPPPMIAVRFTAFLNAIVTVGVREEGGEEPGGEGLAWRRWAGPT